MLIGNLSGFCASWVDNHKAATALLNCFKAFGHIRHRHNAAVRGQWIAANNQHVLRMVNIGHRNK